MTKFDKFKEEFDKLYKNTWEFMCDWEEDKNPLNGVLEADLDENKTDSYGDDDSILQRVYNFPDFDILIMFYGTRQSHNGTEWDGMKEVKKTTKLIEVYE